MSDIKTWRSGALIQGALHRLDTKAGLTTGQNTWPTPCARDYKGPSGPMSSYVGLPKAVQPAARTKPAKKLNPDWVTWLMGFPEGWLD